LGPRARIRSTQCRSSLPMMVWSSPALIDQLRKGSAEKPEETLHRALDLGYGSLTSGGVWLVVDKIRSFLRCLCLCIAGADDRHVAALHLGVAT
jgi:hypothetical protein